ncbi:MAG: S9 family peptidase [Marinilabiliaceae bacterium]|nr:S9 family peptidase [Marinilabiliaceae bacterium]
MALGCIAGVSAITSCDSPKKEIAAPVAKIEPTELTKHGHTRVDNYFWMKNRDTEDVLNYLNAENDYTQASMQETEQFQANLYDEMLGRIKQTDNSVPYLENGYYYYSRYEEGKEYPIHCRKKGSLEAEEEILLNVNEMAKGYAYYQVGDYSVSSNNQLLAYTVDTVSRRKYTVYFKDLKSGEVFSDQIGNTSGGVSWANDNKTVFYSTKDETLRSNKIHRFSIGDKAPVEVFEETDATFGCWVYKTKSSKYMVIGSSATMATEYQILEADNPSGQFKVFEPRHEDMLYDIDHYGDKFIVSTNHEAKNFRFMETPENKTGIENWKELIAHREDVLLEGFELFDDFMVVQERKLGLTQLRVINQSTKEEHYLDFGEATYMAYISTNREFNSEVLRFGYGSMTTPNSTFDYNMNTRAKTLMKQQEVLGEFDSDDYQTDRLWATAEDGTKIPISIVYKKELFKKDGTNPMMVYAYGSYGSSMDPYFSSVRLSLLDRGFVYALAHIRGGQELGRYWYEDGKKLKKKNTFTDFIACTEYMQENGYSSPEKTFASGGSAGGLLMGAVANMKPEIYNGMIAAVPFVDVITTMLDETIPLTTGEYDEWGNPNEKEYYDYILSYSPYDNVEAKAYPNLLVTTGYHDSQVQYWEPAKWVAKLRAMKTDNKLVLLHTNMDFGHGGASGRFERLKEYSLEYAFVFKLAGIKE